MFQKAIVVVLVFAGLLYACRDNGAVIKKQDVQVLIFSKTNSFRHECIEPGSAALNAYFETYGIKAVLSEDPTLFTPEKLSEFDAIMFFQTSGNVLDSSQQIAFESYFRSGKGFVGVHSAADTEYDWPWYGQMLGAYFASHPHIQSAALQKTDTAHISCKHLPDRWTRTDEWYNFKEFSEHIQVVLTIDEATYQGGTHGLYHPMSWYQEIDGGRSFYTALGHTVESYQDTLFLEHLRQAVVWAAGKS